MGEYQDRLVSRALFVDKSRRNILIKICLVRVDFPKITYKRHNTWLQYIGLREKFIIFSVGGI